VKNLIAAAMLGFNNFRDNFIKHLKDAIFDWLTGSLEGITLPSTWDLKGIASVALQMIGLTWTNIRAKLVALIGEKPMQALETGFDLVITLVRDGPLAAWEKIHEMGEEIKQAFMDGVKDFIKIKIVQEAIKTVVALFAPAAGIIKAIIGIYDTVVFFIQKAKQIAEFIGSFLGSIAEIAAGNIQGAADALERGLATGLKLVIDFLARLLHLDGITAKIRAAIQKLRAKVDGMLDRIVGWIAEKAKALWRLATGAAGRVVAWWKARKSFRTRSGEAHSLFLHGEGTGAELRVASQEELYRNYVNRVAVQPGDTIRTKARNTALTKLAAIEGLIKRNLEDGKKTTEFDGLLTDLATATVELMSGVPRPEPTPPIYGSLSSGGFATTMTMNVLTNHNLPAGTPPSESMSSGVWNILKDRYEKPTSGRRFYKLGHLLSYQLGGPGNNWSNLTPQSESGNQSFERGQGERQIKRWVLDEGKGVRYHVTANYGRSSNKSAIIALWQTRNEPDLERKRSILEAEEHVPVSLSYSYQVIFENGAMVAGGKVVDGSAPNEIRQDPEKYHLL